MPVQAGLWSAVVVALLTSDAAATMNTQSPEFFSSINEIGYPLGCPPGSGNDKLLMYDYLQQLDGLGVGGSFGSLADGSWDCTYFGFPVYFYDMNDNPLTGSHPGLTVIQDGQVSILLDYDYFVGLNLCGSDLELGSALGEWAELFLHELYHGFFFEWLYDYCVPSSACLDIFNCHFLAADFDDPETPGMACVEMQVWGETSRILCSLACDQPAGSQLRKDLGEAANSAQRKQDLYADRCEDLLDPSTPPTCDPLPLPPSEFEPGQAWSPTGPCCCQEGGPQTILAGSSCDHCDPESFECQLEEDD